MEKLGQIYRYRPEDETLELFYEGTETNGIESPDNIIVAPWGDLFFVEDEAIMDGDKKTAFSASPLRASSTNSADAVWETRNWPAPPSLPMGKPSS